LIAEKDADVVRVQRTYCRNVTGTKSYNRAVVETELAPTLDFAERSPNRAPVAPQTMRPGLSSADTFDRSSAALRTWLKSLTDQQATALVIV
jgi:hypothetical protein